MEAHQFPELIEAELLQSLLDHFNKATGIPATFVSAKEATYRISGWQDLCQQFYQAAPDARERCVHDDKAFKQALQAGNVVNYLCHQGLRTIGLPVMVDHELVGTIIVGHFFYQNERPSHETNIAQAAKYGFNEQEYITAIEKIPVFSHLEIDRILVFSTDAVRFIEQSAERTKKVCEGIREREQALKLMALQRDLAFKLSKPGSFSEILELCLEFALKVGGIDGGGCYRVTPDGGVSITCYHGLSEEFISTRKYYPPNSVHANTIGKQVPEYVEVDTLREVTRDNFENEKLTSFGFIPIIGHGKPIACLNVGSHTQDRIPLIERYALEAIAAQISNALTQADSDK